MDFLPINAEFEDTLMLQMTYEISRPSAAISSISNVVVERLKN